MKLLKFCVLMTLFIIIGFNQMLSAQNLKKVYKDIESSENDKAQEELNKFTNEVKNSGEDFLLYSFANCLLLCNENTQDYDPYKALEIYGTTTKYEVNQSDIDKFLSKYSLSINKIKEIICSSILSQAKKVNTEASYHKAILSFNKAQEYGIHCGFKPEVDTLWVNAAYNEAKIKNTYEAYVNFYTYHGNSRYTQEVHKKFNEFAFQRAKNNISLESINNYIKGHSEKDNPYLSEAIRIRDSIAYKSLSESYYDYQSFIDKYPDSEHTGEIKKMLPNLLYRQATSEQNISLMNIFINENPNDERVVNMKAEVERLEYLSLLRDVSLVNFEDFKRRYPNSKYENDITERYNKLLSNNDLKRYGLKGAVKSIEYISEDKEKMQFNEMGYLTYCEPIPVIDEDLRKSLSNRIPINFNDEQTVRFFGSGVALGIDNMQERTYGTSGLTYEYRNGALISVKSNAFIWKFEYDEKGNLTTKDIFEFYPRLQKNPLRYRIKYGWSNDKLKYKHVYDPNGKEHFTIDITYSGNEAEMIIRGNRNYKFIATIDDAGLIGSITKYLCTNTYLDEYRLEEKNYYKYSNGNLTQVTCNGFLEGHVTSNYFFNRDSHGQITNYVYSIGQFTKYNDKEYTYIYDSHGNWVEVTTYKVIENDITIRTKESVITRTIIYY
nr:hypothetical protein [uncultured Draconibacterium sp.]